MPTAPLEPSRVGAATETDRAIDTAYIGSENCCEVGAKTPWKAGTNPPDCDSHIPAMRYKIDIVSYKSGDSQARKRSRKWLMDKTTWPAGFMKASKNDARVGQPLERRWPDVNWEAPDGPHKRTTQE